MSHIFVIAEAGSCHDNSFTKALRLIDAAKACGADACKFQFWSHPGKLAARRGLGPDAKAVYERYQLPASWLPRLKDHCDESGIEFMCTAYLIEDIEIIAPFVKRFKVSAYESPWQDFVDANILAAKPIILSTGTTRWTFVNPILSRLCQDNAISRLWCRSEYPCPLEHLNLKAMETCQYEGLSDHTTSTLTGALAVAAGASIVEKHFRLPDTATDCPDFGHALHPIEFGDYIRNIREAERAM